MTLWQLALTNANMSNSVRSNSKRFSSAGTDAEVTDRIKRGLPASQLYTSVSGGHCSCATQYKISQVPIFTILPSALLWCYHVNIVLFSSASNWTCIRDSILSIQVTTASQTPGAYAQPLMSGQLWLRDPQSLVCCLWLYKMACKMALHSIQQSRLADSIIKPINLLFQSRWK